MENKAFLCLIICKIEKNGNFIEILNKLEFEKLIKEKDIHVFLG